MATLTFASHVYNGDIVSKEEGGHPYRILKVEALTSNRIRLVGALACIHARKKIMDDGFDFESPLLSWDDSDLISHNSGNN